MIKRVIRQLKQLDSNENAQKEETLILSKRKIRNPQENGQRAHFTQSSSSIRTLAKLKHMKMMEELYQEFIDSL